LAPACVFAGDFEAAPPDPTSTAPAVSASPGNDAGTQLSSPAEAHVEQLEASAAPNRAPEQDPPNPVAPGARPPSDKPGAGGADEGTKPPAAGAKPSGPLRIERGEGELPILVPRDEELVFQVSLNLGILGDPRVGMVTISSRVDTYHATPLLIDGEPRVQGERATISALAEGRYAVYELHELITTILVPQAWPSAIHRNRQWGTENRQNELLIGKQDGEFVASYRSDRHCKGCLLRSHFVKPSWLWQDEHHCKKCKRAEHRIWRDAQRIALPEGTLDMVSAVMLARTMVREGVERVSFPMLDKDELWHVVVTRGARRVLATPAGRFDAVQVLLDTRPPPGAKGREEDFEGMFGIHGTIDIWMEAATGVPVLIHGLVGVGPLELDVNIALSSFRGTPPEFRGVGR